ncbi:hypothetical protein ElyMa_003515900 [Elysia marginata]|uniref:Uncharacterized protein n=1 Tax=Elysia marginata TaxID=1093978 RepID=A0AAV4EGD9_9GAST|nr:hypothetical protein ElyMa_003515900 [Elysia marginata]
MPMHKSRRRHASRKKRGSDASMGFHYLSSFHESVGNNLFLYGAGLSPKSPPTSPIRSKSSPNVSKTAASSSKTPRRGHAK